MTNIMTLTETERQRLWPLVAYNLTVAARETYTAGTNEAAGPPKLRIYNEMLIVLLRKSWPAKPKTQVAASRMSLWFDC